MPAEPRPEESGSDVGLAGGDLETLAERVLTAWDAFLDVAAGADLAAPSRLPGFSGADVCIHLGRWPDSHPLRRVLASARDGGRGEVPHPDDVSRRLVQAHRDASPREVLDALVGARTAVAEFFSSPQACALGRRVAASAVGPLPVLSVVHAGCYELAVHALDLATCGAPPPEPGLLHSGLAALVDVTGALAARHAVDVTMTAQTPNGGWRFRAGDDGWETAEVPAGQVTGPAVLAATANLLDLSAGRLAVPPLLASGRLRVQSIGSMVRLAPLVVEIPGLPGRGALRRAASVMTGGGWLLGRWPGRRG